jgi:two-component system heavy metal sensor histidine kinase CusS
MNRVASPHSLTRKLSIWLVLQAFVVLGVVCALVYAAAALTLAERQDATLVEKKAMVRHMLGKAAELPSSGELVHTLNDFLIGHEELGLVLRLPDGRLFSAGVSPDRSEHPIKRIDFGIEAEAAGATPGSATLYMDTAPDALLLRRLAWILAVAAVAGAVLASLGSALLVRRAMSPLKLLIRQVQALQAEDLREHLDGSAQPLELQPLVEQFNALLLRLDSAYQHLEAFNADVAHELNTPLAMLVSSCQLGLQRSRSSEEMREILAANLEDLDRMTAIVRDMLFLAKADRGNRVSQESVVDLAVLCREVLDFHEAVLHEAGLQARIDGHAVVSGDPGLLQRALSNLLSNAVRHARPGTQIVVRIAGAAGRRCSLAVENQGDALAERELGRIFERFYRADSSRRDGGAHHGLGLAIVAAIARMHGGQTFARSADGITTIGLQLPSGSPTTR